MNDGEQTTPARRTTQATNRRSAILRTLYTWLNLTLLLALGWPALIFFTSAPATRPRDMPMDWFSVRLLITLAVLALVVRFWRSSGIPGEVARFDRAMEIFEGSWLRQQVGLILVGTTGILAFLLLSSAVEPALRILLLGLAEALVVQALIAGYVKGVFDELDVENWKSFLVTISLFTATFALRSVIASGTQSDTTPNMILASLAAGAVLGGVVGAISMTTRERMGTLLPGILSQWLLLAIIPAFLEG